MRGRQAVEAGVERLVTFEQDGDVAIIQLNDPATLNAMSVPMIVALGEAFDQAEAKARAAMLCGNGRGFCSGWNLTAAPETRDGGPPDLGLTLEQHINPLMRRLRELSIPWISAVHGAAAGAGASLALAADMIVAGESAYFLQAFRRIGLVPDAGATWLLARAAGRVRAMEMMLLGEKLPAPRALDWGLINRVVKDDDVTAEAMKLARELAAGPTHTLAMIRRAAWTGAEGSFADALQTERTLQTQAGQSADFAEGVRAFAEKRAARFYGR
jgi:2-(1,2-epoxy-1,2-dihydrophenyl)acetyl-CoA isomerase